MKNYSKSTKRQSFYLSPPADLRVPLSHTPQSSKDLQIAKNYFSSFFSDPINFDKHKIYYFIKKCGDTIIGKGLKYFCNQHLSKKIYDSLLFLNGRSDYNHQINCLIILYDNAIKHGQDAFANYLIKLISLKSKKNIGTCFLLEMINRKVITNMETKSLLQYVDKLKAFCMNNIFHWKKQSRHIRATILINWLYHVIMLGKEKKTISMLEETPVYSDSRVLSHHIRKIYKKSCTTIINPIPPSVPIFPVTLFRSTPIEILFASFYWKNSRLFPNRPNHNYNNYICLTLLESRSLPRLPYPDLPYMYRRHTLGKYTYNDIFLPNEAFKLTPFSFGLLFSAATDISRRVSFVYRKKSNKKTNEEILKRWNKIIKRTEIDSTSAGLRELFTTFADHVKKKNIKSCNKFIRRAIRTPCTTLIKLHYTNTTKQTRKDEKEREAFIKEFITNPDQPYHEHSDKHLCKIKMQSSALIYAPYSFINSKKAHHLNRTKPQNKTLFSISDMEFQLQMLRKLETKYSKKIKVYLENMRTIITKTRIYARFANNFKQLKEINKFENQISSKIRYHHRKIFTASSIRPSSSSSIPKENCIKDFVKYLEKNFSNKGRFPTYQKPGALINRIIEANFRSTTNCTRKFSL